MGKAHIFSTAFVLVLIAACGGNKRGSGYDDTTPDKGGANDDGGLFGNGGGGDGGGGSQPSGDPKTCEQAAAMKSYIGCDYWPTVVANAVWSVFDFAAVVANAGDQPADVTITGPNGTNQHVTVAPQRLAKVYLPWVQELKGPDADCTGHTTPLKTSVFSAKGAYHLVSSVPVTVYQFNALEYQPQGGPPGKQWGTCPGAAPGCSGTCLSYSNDASLLLPSTAMTGNYRIASIHGWTEDFGSTDLMGAYFAITGTVDGTNVTVKVASGGQIVGGGKINATNAGGLLHFTLDAGDVAEIVGPPGDKHDLSGSQVAADQPVQVISGISCINIPEGMTACDHVEESVLPAETLGKHYVVSMPTGPNGQPVGHLVRIYGNVDGTRLKGLPASCPGGGIVNAGQVVDCGVVNQDFEITGDHEFSVGSFQQGSLVVDPGALPGSEEGDPAQSQMIAVEQFRTKYIFLAPNDYDTNFIDVVAEPGTKITLDGIVTNAVIRSVPSSNLGVARVKLGPGQDGAHVVTADKPFGIQVLGYGKQTSYQYPGGLDLHAIAPPPPTPK